MSVSFRRLRNLLAPISRLPPELLSTIFCYVQHAAANELEDNIAADGLEPFDDPFKYPWVKIKDWIKITRVCHAWREVAMNTSLLWSHLFVTRRHYKWAEECLRRSKQSSLVLLVDLSEDYKRSPRPEAVIRELRNHLRRSRVLNLRLSTRDLFDLLSQIETPRLVNFQYVHHDYSNSPADPRSSPPVIGDSIFQLADSLRRLSITCCPIDWSASIFHRLTHLQLQEIPKKSKLKCHDFVSFLTGIPNLEVLYLRRSLRKETLQASGLPPAEAARAPLQHLKHMDLTENGPDLAGFLSSITIPPLCKTIVNPLPDAAPSHLTLEAFLPTLSWAYDHFHPPIPSSGPEYYQNYWRSLRLFIINGYFGVQGYVVEEKLTRDKILFELCIWNPEDGGENVMEHIPLSLLTSLPMSHIVYLEIWAGCSVLSESMWIEFFGSIPTLKSVCIEANSLPFFRALFHDPGDSDDVPFPVLSSVMLRLVTYPDLDYHDILKSLRWRLGLGVPLRRLLMDGCPAVPSSVMKQLKKVVAHIEIGGLH